MPEFIDDLIAVNKQLRNERDHYRRALMHLADQIAATTNKPADDIFDDALFEVAHG